jgi:hypothetical protein
MNDLQCVGFANHPFLTDVCLWVLQKGVVFEIEIEPNEK